MVVTLVTLWILVKVYLWCIVWSFYVELKESIQVRQDSIVEIGLPLGKKEKPCDCVAVAVPEDTPRKEEALNRAFNTWLQKAPTMTDEDMDNIINTTKEATD